MLGKPADPWEEDNRAIFRFNDRLDKALFEPAAKAYVRVMPRPVRTGVSNFYDNITYLDTVLNDFLQGKGRQGIADTGRFLINSTVGILGIFDVATRMGLDEHDEDFGQTLAVWGSREGNYLILPLLGPSTERDAPGWVVSSVTNVLAYAVEGSALLPLSLLGVIDARARARGAFEFADRTALDRYTFIREAYRQRRTYLIYDGSPPLVDFFEDIDESPPPGGVPP
ncbi:MAG: VacJ family lipoprotein [Gammaproteobacteria bacterium]|nr:VacJ family lipoprotein [Gammaproteobacteria bacterium]NIR97532.1 VacJ family lipoprotein [Gammaproteobacteria bacterium]NIT63165.1 VacJ family lipoprotein [Gammaproteobacteria bacterium]NIV20114.1 VacJ family lipoprotein [Gammaproteobacteria bacterium]NIX11415.1 VacJ family lipoprotein [Gammaproteobacteria bacterium]